MLRRFVHRKITNAILNGIRAHWFERKFLSDLLARLKVDCVFDVGANVGQYGEELRLIGYKGQIISFEPDPECFRKLAMVASKDSKWHVHNVALGSVPGEGEFNIMAMPVFNSFRKPSAIATNSFDEENKILKTEIVSIDTLSRVLPRFQETLQFSSPYLKMDTQGFDLEVFEGARDVHHSIVGMQSEVAVQPIYESIPPWGEAIAVYEANGFELAGLYPVNPSSPELVEFNCFFVRAGSSRSPHE